MHKTVGWGRRMLFATLDYIKNSYIAFWVVMLAISVYGWLLIYSANYRWGSVQRTIYTQAIAILLGLIAAVFISLIDYERLGELWWLVGGFCVVLMIVTIIFGQGATGASSVSENRAWLKIAGVSFQSAELLKIGFIVTFSYHLAHVTKQNMINNIREVILLIVHMFVPIVLNLLTLEYGNPFMLIFVCIILFISSGINWKYIMAGILSILVAVPLLWNFMAEYQKDRFRAVFNPMPGDELDILYQQTQGKIAMGGGKLLGQGFLKGTMVQNGLVPECSNDFIFTVAGEEFGFIGCMVVIILLVALMIMCVKTALEARDDMGRFICMGFFATIAVQTIFNVGMCLMILPVIGVTLPFFSAGGSSSMCLYFGFGLVLSVYMRRGESKMKIAY